MTVPDTLAIAIDAVPGRADTYELTFHDATVTGRVRVRLRVGGDLQVHAKVDLSPRAKKKQDTGPDVTVVTSPRGTRYIDPFTVNGVALQGELVMQVSADEPYDWIPTFAIVGPILNDAPKTAQWVAAKQDVQRQAPDIIAAAVGALVTRRRAGLAYETYYVKQHRRAIKKLQAAQASVTEAESGLAATSATLARYADSDEPITR